MAAVYADVWHPDTLPECGSFKYQLEMHLIPKIAGPDGNVEELKALVQDAYDDGLITFNSGYDIVDVIHQIDQCLADVFRGEQVMDYHQPEGDYKVEVIAFDSNNNMSDPLMNYFTYVALTKVAFDFENVSYGPVEVCTNKWVGGNAHVTYDPTDLGDPVMTTIPGILQLCNTEKLDFSIHVKKAPAGKYDGNMIIGSIWAEWNQECPDIEPS